MTASLKAFAQRLRALPRVVAHKVAQRAAPLLTEAAQASFRASEDPYGVAWDLGAEGQRVTLRKTGTLLDAVRYVAIGTRIRLAIATNYAKYQVGRRPVTPRPGEPLPAAYAGALEQAAHEVIREELAA